MLAPFPLTVILLGLSVFAVIVVQVLIGLRVIRFRGRRHLLVHRWTAYTILAVALAHGLLALALFGLLPGF